MAINQVTHFPILSRKKGAEVHIHRTSRIVYAYIFFQGYVRFSLYMVLTDLWPLFLTIQQPFPLVLFSMSPLEEGPTWTMDQLFAGRWTHYLKQQVHCDELCWASQIPLETKTISDYQEYWLQKYHAAKSLPGICHISCKVMHPTHTTILWEVIQHNQWLNVERAQTLGSLYSVGTIVKGNNSSRGVHRISQNLSCSFIRFQLHSRPNPPSLTPY